MKQQAMTINTYYKTKEAIIT